MEHHLEFVTISIEIVEMLDKEKTTLRNINIENDAKSK